MDPRLLYYLLLAMPSMTFASIFSRGPSKIDRPEKFTNLSGNFYFDISKYETSLMHLVEPAPISAITEVLYDHVKPYEKSFASNLKYAAGGKGVMIGSSYDSRAAEDCRVLMHDYLPSNTADAAAALYLFTVKECKIRNTDKKTPSGMNACQYIGAKILAGIVRRLQTVNAIKSIETNANIPADKRPNQVINSAPFKALERQALQMLQLFSSSEYSEYLGKTDPDMFNAWNELKTRLLIPGRLS